MSKKSRIVLMKRISEYDPEGNPDKVFIFCDNMKRTGRKGQAVYGRTRTQGEKPNCIGIPTKWTPSTGSGAYFKDSDWYKVISTIDRDLDRVEDALRQGKMVVFPKDGIGTGLSKLDRTAPRIFNHIMDRLEEMGRSYGFRKNPSEDSVEEVSDKTNDVEIGMLVEQLNHVNEETLAEAILSISGDIASKFSEEEELTLVGIKSDKAILNKIKASLEDGWEDDNGKKFNARIVITIVKNPIAVIKRCLVNLLIADSNGQYDTRIIPKTTNALKKTQTDAKAYFIFKEDGVYINVFQSKPNQPGFFKDDIITTQNPKKRDAIQLEARKKRSKKQEKLDKVRKAEKDKLQGKEKAKRILEGEREERGRQRTPGDFSPTEAGSLNYDPIGQILKRTSVHKGYKASLIDQDWERAGIDFEMMGEFGSFLRENLNVEELIFPFTDGMVVTAMPILNGGVLEIKDISTGLPNVAMAAHIIPWEEGMADYSEGLELQEFYDEDSADPALKRAYILNDESDSILFEASQDLFNAIVGSSDICIAISNEEETGHLTRLLNITEGESDFENYVITAFNDGKPVLLINPDIGYVEFFDGEGSVGGLGLLENLGDDEINLIGMAILDRQILKKEASSTVRSKVSVKKIKRQESTEKENESLQTLLKASKKSKKKYNKISFDVEIPISYDPLLRKEKLDPRLLIVPVWDYKDASKYFSSYGKSIEDFEMRKRARDFLKAWSNNSSTYLTYWYGRLLERADPDIEEPFFSFVTKDAFELTDLEALASSMKKNNMPDGLADITELEEGVQEAFFAGQTENDPVGGMGNMRAFFQLRLVEGDDASEIVDLVVPYHQFGSGLLMQDKSSSSDEPDEGLNILFVYMYGDFKIEADIDDVELDGIDYLKIKRSYPVGTDKIPLATKNWNEYAEMAERNLSDVLEQTIKYLTAQYKGVVPKILIPERALSPRDDKFEDTFLAKKLGTGENNPVITWLKDKKKRYEVLGEDSFSYDSKIGGKPLVTEKKNALRLGVQSDTGNGAQLYLLNTKPGILAEKAIDKAKNDKELISNIQEEGDILMNAILDGTKAMGERFTAFLKPVLAVSLSDAFLMKKRFISVKDQWGEEREFSINDYITDRSIAPKVKVGSKQVKTLRAIRDVLLSKDTEFQFTIGVGSSEPKPLKRRLGTGEVIQYGGKMSLGSQDVGENFDGKKGTIDVSGTGVNIRMPKSIRKTIIEEDSFGLEEVTFRVGIMTNYPLNSILSLLTREVLVDGETLKFRGFNYQSAPNSSRITAYDNEPSFRIIEAPIIPVVEYLDTYVDNASGDFATKQKMDIASQYVYESLERRLRAHTVIEDQYTSIPVIAFDYDDFKDYNTFRRVTRDGRVSIYKGHECLLAVIKIVLQYAGNKAIVYNLPDKLFSSNSAKEAKMLSTESVRFSEDQLSGEKKRIIEDNLIKNSNISCMFGVIGSGKGGNFTFTIGDLPDYLLKDFASSDIFATLVDKGVLIESDAKSMEFSSSPIASYFFEETTDADGYVYDTPKKFRLHEDAEISIAGMAIDPSDVLGDIKPNIEVYNFLEEVILNNQEILDNLLMLDIKKNAFERQAAGTSPFNATSAEWGVFNNKFKDYRRIKEATTEKIAGISESFFAEDGNWISKITAEMKMFDSYSQKYLRDMKKIMLNLTTPSPRGFSESEIKQMSVLFAMPFNYKEYPLNLKGVHTPWAYPFVSMDKLDSNIILESSDATTGDLIPLDLQGTYLEAKLDFLLDIETACQELISLKLVPNTPLDGERYSAEDYLLWMNNWAENAISETERDLNSLIRKEGEFADKIEDALKRGTEGLEMPTPPTGREPRLSLFAITEDGSFFKITKSRGKLKKVNEYPFFIASDEFSPLNLQLGALLAPPKAGTLIADIASFGFKGKEVDAIMQAPMSDREDMAADYLSKRLAHHGKKGAAKMMASGDRGQQITTALSHFGNKFKRIYPEDRKDFYVNTPSIKRYSRTILNGLKNQAKSNLLQGVVCRKAWKETHETIDEDVSYDDLHEFLNLDSSTKKQLDYYIAVNYGISNGWKSMPTEGAALIKYDSDKTPHIEEMRNYEASMFKLASDLESGVQFWLKEVSTDSASAFEKCIILPSIRGMSPSLGGHGLLASAKEILKRRIDKRDMEIQSRKAAQEFDLDILSKDAEEMYCALALMGVDFYGEWANEKKTTGNRYLDFRIKLSSLNFFFRGGNKANPEKADGGMTYIIDGTPHYDMEFIVPNLKEFRNEASKRHPFGNDADIALSKGITKMFKNFYELTDGVILSHYPDNDPEIPLSNDDVPKIYGDVNNRAKVLKALDLILKAIAAKVGEENLKPIISTDYKTGSVFDTETPTSVGGVLGLYAIITEPYKNGNSMLSYINDGDKIPETDNAFDNDLAQIADNQIIILNKLLSVLIKHLSKAFLETVCKPEMKK